MFSHLASTWRVEINYPLLSISFIHECNKMALDGVSKREIHREKIKGRRRSIRGAPQLE